MIIDVTNKITGLNERMNFSLMNADARLHGMITYANRAQSDSGISKKEATDRAHKRRAGPAIIGNSGKITPFFRQVTLVR
jgi:hypothetical protein